VKDMGNRKNIPGKQKRNLKKSSNDSFVKIARQILKENSLKRR
jgi:hypothetical protein